MTIKIIIDSIIMHRSINIQNPKQVYPFKWNNLTYFDYDDDCFNIEESDLKILIVLVM